MSVDARGTGGGLERTLDRASTTSPTRSSRGRRSGSSAASGSAWAARRSCPTPGDYVVKEVAGESILVVRTQDGGLGGALQRLPASRLAARARLRHRGASPAASAVPTTRGPTPSTASSAPPRSSRKPMGSPGASLVRSTRWASNLGRLRLRESHAGRGGRRAVTRSPPSSAPCRSGSGAIRSPSSASARRITYEVRANWKVMLENYNECYHCGPVHPELCRLVPAFRQRGGSELDWERGIPHREGAWTFTASGTTNRAPFAGLDEDERMRHKGELIYPNFLLSLSRRARGGVPRLSARRPTAPRSSTSSCSIPTRWRSGLRSRRTRWNSGTW